MLGETDLAKLWRQRFFYTFLHSDGHNLPYNFATNAIQMILPENNDLFGGHLLALFLDIEVAGIFSSHLSGFKKTVCLTRHSATHRKQ